MMHRSKGGNKDFPRSDKLGDNKTFASRTFFQANEKINAGFLPCLKDSTERTTLFLKKGVAFKPKFEKVCRIEIQCANLSWLTARTNSCLISYKGLGLCSDCRGLNFRIHDSNAACYHWASALLPKRKLRKISFSLFYLFKSCHESPSST